jgi:hypothetical protein
LVIEASPLGSFEMFTPREILYTSAVPAAVALLFLVAAWRPWKRRDAAVLHGHWGGPLAAGLAFLASYALLDGEVPGWPPAQARHWLFYLAAGLTVVGLADSLLPRFVSTANWFRAEIALLASGGAVLCLFSSLLAADNWPAPVAARWMVGMTAILHLVWVSTERLNDRLPRAAGPGILFVFASGVALVMLLSGSLVYGRMAGVLAVVAATALIVSLLAPAFSFSHGGITVLIPLSVCVLYLGYHLADPGVGNVNGALLLSSLILPWFARIPALGRRKPWVRVMVAIMLAALPVAVAAYRARDAFLRAQQEEPTGELYTRHTLFTHAGS